MSDHVPAASLAGGAGEPLRWGVLLPTFDVFGRGAPPVVAAARLAEDLGFDAVWAGDHLVARVPVLDSLGSLCAAAAVTSRVEVGVSVLQIALRHLVWTAKQLATIDALAPGRLRLGVGVGGEYPEEFVATHSHRETRGRVVDEMLGVLPALLDGRPVDHPGPLAPLTTPALLPALSRRPPISVGGRSRAALVRTVRFGDQWLPMWREPKAVREQAEALAALAADRGRSAPSVGLLILANVDPHLRVSHRDAAAGFERQYRIPFDVVERWTAYGPGERVAEMILEYQEAGVSELIMMPLGPDTLGQYERFVSVRELVDTEVARRR